MYLFDEVNALAGDRVAPNDVGEIRRVLNSFLQFMDEESSDSIIAATNHPSFSRTHSIARFDTVMDFALPDDVAIEAVFRAKDRRCRPKPSMVDVQAAHIRTAITNEDTLRSIGSS